MTDQNPPVKKHLVSAREHMAGVKAAAAWRRELIDAHLLDTETPIRDQPVKPGAGTGS